jgi:hypothetical protein
VIEETITRTRFQIGDDVPSWLIDAEPIHAASIQGKFTFSTPCDVLDLPDYFAVIPLPYGPIPSVIDFTGAGCRVFAASKPVRLVCGQQTFHSAEINGWAHQIGAIGEKVPRKPFLARLADAFR